MIMFFSLEMFAHLVTYGTPWTYHCTEVWWLLSPSVTACIIASILFANDEVLVSQIMFAVAVVDLGGSLGCSRACCRQGLKNIFCRCLGGLAAGIGILVISNPVFFLTGCILTILMILPGFFIFFLIWCILMILLDWVHDDTLPRTKIIGTKSKSKGSHPDQPVTSRPSDRTRRQPSRPDQEANVVAAPNRQSAIRSSLKASEETTAHAARKVKKTTTFEAFRVDHHFLEGQEGQEDHHFLAIWRAACPSTQLRGPMRGGATDMAWASPSTPVQ